MIYEIYSFKFSIKRKKALFTLFLRRAKEFFFFFNFERKITCFPVTIACFGGGCKGLEPC